MKVNLANLKTLVYRQETFSGTVTDKRYEPPKRFGIGIGTLAPDNWYITVEDKAGNTYVMSTNRPDFFSAELNKGDEVTLKVTRIFGIPVYRKAGVRR